MAAYVATHKQIRGPMTGPLDAASRRRSAAGRLSQRHIQYLQYRFKAALTSNSNAAPTA